MAYCAACYRHRRECRCDDPNEAAIRADERAKTEAETVARIVAWLRSRDTVWSKDYADAIEQGAHRPKGASAKMLAKYLTIEAGL